MFPNPNLVKDVKPMRDDPLTTDLVTRAGSGDKQAWDALVERYAPLVWSICRRHQLGTADADDVGQTVWLQLVDHLDRVRDPAALPGWLATTTRRECVRFLRTARRSHATRYVPDVENIPDAQAETAEQELLAAERHAALREAFGDLPLFSQQLIALLIQDPPVQYAEISARLGIAVGSVGPHRGRCLEKLRRHPAIAALINADTSAAADCGPAAAVDRRGAAAGSALTASGAAEPAARWSSVDAEKPIPLPDVWRTSLPNVGRTQWRSHHGA
jgi:RNA polymerase sigma factor (sigma-70 family)